MNRRTQNDFIICPIPCYIYGTDNNHKNVKRPFYINVQYGPSLSDTHKTAKINFITSWAVNIIRSSYYLHLFVHRKQPTAHDVTNMKLIFGVLYVNCNYTVSKKFPP